jgi:hypothetical protein
MKRLLHLIADYKPLSQEFAEILQRIHTQNWALDITLLPTSVPSMDTIGTGFLTYQLALGPNPPGTLFYVNTAPRALGIKGIPGRSFFGYIVLSRRGARKVPRPRGWTRFLDGSAASVGDSLQSRPVVLGKRLRSPQPKSRPKAISGRSARYFASSRFLSVGRKDR